MHSSSASMAAGDHSPALPEIVSRGERSGNAGVFACTPCQATGARMRIINSDKGKYRQTSLAAGG
jgi:hypothetical protein